MPRNLILALLPTLAIAACSDAASDHGGPPAYDDVPEEPRDELTELAFDVSEDMSRFLMDEAPIHEDGMPNGGNSFVTSGYLYPEGFLADRDGVDADGAPAYPESVLGTWTCRGFFLGEGAYELGPALATTQTYMIYDEPGHDPLKLAPTLIVTDGFEMMVTDVPVTRAVIGTSGALSGKTGQMVQVLEDLDPIQGVTLSVRFTLEDR